MIRTCEKVTRRHLRRQEASGLKNGFSEVLLRGDLEELGRLQQEGFSWFCLPDARLVAQEDEIESFCGKCAASTRWKHLQGLPLRPVTLIAPGAGRVKVLSRSIMMTLINSLNSLNWFEPSSADQEALELAQMYGFLFPIRWTTLFARPSYLECDSVDDWLSLAADVQATFALLGSIQEGNPSLYTAVSNGVAWLDFRALGKSFESVSVRVDDDASEESTARNLLARLLTLGMAQASYSRKGVALSSGQIVALSVPQNLYSAVWQMIEAAVTEAPVLSHLRLRRCCLCGEWAFERGDPEACSPPPMSRRKSDGAWYEVRCKKRIAKQGERGALRRADSSGW